MRIKIPDLNNIRRFWLYAFIFLLGYENWNTLQFGGPVTLARLAGVVYFGLALTSGQRMFSLNRDNKILISLLVILWAWLLFCSLMAYIRLGISIKYNATLVQLIVLYWLIVNEIRWEPAVRDRIFLAFILGAFSVYVLIDLGVGVHIGRDGDLVESIEGVRRVWFMGMNPNDLGNLAALSFVLSLHLFVEKFNASRYSLTLLIPLAMLPFMVGLSGSGGAYLVLLLGVVLLILLRKESLMRRLRYLFIGSVLIMILVYLLSNFEYLIDKIERFFKHGDTTNRFELWNYSLSVIQKYPITGVGSTNGVDWAFRFFGSDHTTAHNIFLDIWMWGGIIAVLIFFTFIVIIFWRSWLNRKMGDQHIGLVIFMCVIFLMSKSGGSINIKYFWILLASITPILYRPIEHRSRIYPLHGQYA